ncbi:hypothetical protein MASR1M60_33270 [Rhodocyclaceae bacterium]
MSAALILASALALLVGGGSQNREVDDIAEAVVIVTGQADDAERAASAARRIAHEVGAEPDLVEAFGEHAAFSAGGLDSYAIRFQPGKRRACLVLVRTEEIRSILAFSPQADFDLLVEMLTAHERRHCRQNLRRDVDTPDLDMLRAEVEADAAALGILLPPGTDVRHDTARQAWLLWRNMDAFLTGKSTHWTLPGLFGMELSEAGIEQGLELQQRAARFLLGKEASEPGAAWEALRGTAMGRLLPSWPEFLVAVRHAYGDGPDAVRRALRGEMTRAASMETKSFYLPMMEDLVTSARARGFPAELRIWTANRDAALRYLGQKDGEEKLRIDCYELSPDDSRHLRRCGLVADALFSDGALIRRHSDEIAVSPVGIGIPQWQRLSEAMVRQIGEELTLALTAGHEMAHAAWKLHAKKTAQANGCGGKECDPALFHEIDLEEAYCDLLAVWIVSIHYGLPPEGLLEASAVGRAALEDQDANAWSALAGLLAQARIPGYAQMDFVQASDAALEWALKMPGLKEKWMQ